MTPETREYQSGRLSLLEAVRTANAMSNQNPYASGVKTAFVAGAAVLCFAAGAYFAWRAFRGDK